MRRLPYDWRLRLLPAWLQQLDMESNGKSVDHNGQPLPYTSAPIIWGGSGNDGQHAYYQLLHQGTRLIPADFIVAAEGGPHRDLLVANCLAQTEALMKGRDAEESMAELTAAGVSAAALPALLPHKLVPGNRPTNTILMRRLDAPTLGALWRSMSTKFCPGRDLEHQLLRPVRCRAGQDPGRTDRAGIEA